MCKHFVVFATFSLAIFFVSAKPLPQFDVGDSDLAAPADTFHNGYAFWLGRPYYEMNDDAGDNGNFDSPVRKGTPTMSYASIGGGWGR